MTSRMRYILVLVLVLVQFVVVMACGEKQLDMPRSTSVTTDKNTVEQPTHDYVLKSPWDLRFYDNDVSMHTIQCPEPTDGLLMNIPDRLKNGNVDDKAWSSLTEISNKINLLSDEAVAEGSVAAASCVLDHLFYWAQNDAFVVDSECQKGGDHWKHGYDRSNLINGILTIPYLQIRSASALDESKKSAVLSWFELLFLCSRTRAEGMLVDAQESGFGPHNQVYPALLAVVTLAIALDRPGAFNWAIEKYQQSISTISADGTSSNEVAHKKGWALHYHTLIVNFSVHLSLLGEINDVTVLLDDPALTRLTERVLDSYDDPAYLEELTGFNQTQNPLTTPWNLSWVEHLKRYSDDPRVSKLAKQFQWKLDHTHTGGNPEYWWPEYWE
ncbi:MAG: alginate lyase family protein [SAR202 cluster bacterium]|nr:alginate lyase family protein [SAR202 cluster bacterium]